MSEEAEDEEPVAMTSLPTEIICVLEDIAEIGFEHLKVKLTALRELESKLGARERSNRRPTIFAGTKEEPLGVLDGIQLNAIAIRHMLMYYDRLVQSAEQALVYRRRKDGYMGFE